MPRGPCAVPSRSSLQLREQRGQGRLEVVDRAVVDDHVLGPLGLLLLGQLTRLAGVDQRVAAGGGALAADVLGGDDRDGGVEGRSRGRPRRAAAPRSRRTPCRRGAPAIQAAVSAPTAGWIRDSSQFSSAGSAKTMPPIRPRSVGAPSGATSGPQRSTSSRAQRLAFEQVVDDGVAGERRRAEPAEGRQCLGLARGDAAGQADRQRRRHGPAVSACPRGRH